MSGLFFAIGAVLSVLFAISFVGVLYNWPQPLEWPEEFSPAAE